VRHAASPPDTHVAWRLCDTRSVLVASRESGDGLRDPALGWTGHVKGKLEVRTISGDHLSMQDEANTRAFAQVLRELVQCAEAAVRSYAKAIGAMP